MDNKECIPALLGFFLYFVNSSVGLSQYLQSGMILPLAVSTYIIQHRIKNPPSSVFRCEDNGLWCSLLMLSISYIVEHDGNVILRIVTPITLFVYVFTRCPCTEWRGPHYAVMILLVVHAAVTSRIFVRDPLSITLIVLCSVIYVQLLYKIPEVFKKCFTYGEISILLQLYVCEVYLGLLYSTGLLKMTVLEKLSVIVFVGVHVAIASFYILSRWQCSPLYLWSIMFIVGASYIILSTYYNLSIDELYMLVQQVILNHTSVFLLTWWILWLVSSMLLVCFYGNKTSDKNTIKDMCSTSKQNSSCYEPASNENTDNVADEIMTYKQISPDNHSEDNDDCHKECVHLQFSSSNSQTFMLLRKYFHAAILFVYIPGFMFSPSLLYIASIVAASVLIILEAVRVMKVEPVGSILDEYLGVFLDEQDQGDLILTPIYLMIGCSLPLWWNIKPNNIQCTLTMYSGLVSVGVGDATASYIGRKYGRHKWPGSKKSVEGTLAGFITQLVAVLLLQCCGISGATITMETTICVLLVSLLEAFTLQIDNLVVPIFAWMLLTSLQPTF